MDKDRNRQETGERMAAEQRASKRMVQLLCGVSMLRTSLTQVLPRAGCSAWWTAMICMLPGMAAYLTWLGVLKLTGTSTPAEAARCVLGRAGSWALSVLLGASLLMDAGASLTALVTMFTQGVGARGTQFTMALLTTGVLLICLHPQGLPRGILLLFRAAAAAAGLMLLLSLQSLRPDGVLPLLGERGTWRELVSGPGLGLGWPMMLLAVVPGRKTFRGAGAPAVAVAAVLAFAAMLVPHGELLNTALLADQLLLPTTYVSSGVRMLGQCLLMLLLFLALGAAVLLGMEQLSAPVEHRPGWLPGAALAAMTLTQLAEPAQVMRICNGALRWTPLMLLVLAALAGLAAIGRAGKGGESA